MGAMDELRTAVDENPVWYHTLELAPGLETPGWFDLRPIADHLPWPDLRGKRCLDVATYDGFLAFEMERRGAAEVVATDISSHEDWDWLPRERADGLRYLDQEAGTKGRGFEIAAQALGSSVDRQFVNVYDLRPDRVGVFDVVVCGSLLLHLRDPFRALHAIRGVCDGVFLSAETIDLWLGLVHRRRAVLHLEAETGRWLIPNAMGHRRMLEAAGFDVMRSVRSFALPFGAGHPPVGQARIDRAKRKLRTFTIGGAGVPMSALLARAVTPAT
ncbi:MAG: methyltransferase domain-containing protein [Acidimicrobiales bacterium]